MWWVGCGVESEFSDQLWLSFSLTKLNNLEGLGEMFEGDSASMHAGNKFRNARPRVAARMSEDWGPPSQCFYMILLP